MLAGASRTLGATAGGLWFGVLGAAAAGFLMAAIFAVVAIGCGPTRSSPGRPSPLPRLA